MSESDMLLDKWQTLTGVGFEVENRIKSIKLNCTYELLNGLNGNSFGNIYLSLMYYL